MIECHMIMNVLRTYRLKKILFYLKAFEVKIRFQPTFASFSSHYSLQFSTLVIDRSSPCLLTLIPLPHFWQSAAPHNKILSGPWYLSILPSFRLSSCFISYMKPSLVATSSNYKIQSAIQAKRRGKVKVLPIFHFSLFPFPKLSVLGFLS